MSRPLRLKGYLTMRQVAQALGQPWCAATRKRITRAIRARERETGRELLFNLGQSGACRRWLTTSVVLERAFPEWFPKRDMVAELMEERLRAIVDKQRRQAQKLNALGARLRAIEKALAGGATDAHSGPCGPRSDP